MLEFPPQIERCSQLLRKLPGVGPKASLRYVLAMAQWDKEFLREWVESMSDLSGLSRCSSCFIYVEREGDLCRICANPLRQDQGILCLVENVVDLMAMERSGHYQGVYHILNGLINPLVLDNWERLNIRSLGERLQGGRYGTLILALPPSVEGDITCAYIREQIPSFVQVERLGVGIPMGGNLDYLDPLTISKAIENRRSF